MPNIGELPLSQWGFGATYTVPETAYFNGVMDLVDEEDDGTLTEPVTLDPQKLFTRITTTVENTLVQQFITASRQAIEKFLNVYLIQREITVRLNNPLGGIYFPYGPVDVSTIVLTDYNGNTIEAANYKIVGTTWPQLLWPQACGITATYMAGYIDCPVSIKTALEQEVTYLYRNRGEVDPIVRTGVVQIGLSSVAKSILTPLKRTW